MLQFNKDFLLDENNMDVIVTKVEKILKERKKMYERYSRKTSTDLKIPLEYYITNIAAGFFGGKAPVYTVKQETSDEKKGIIEKLFNKIIGINDSAKEMQHIIDYIRDYNDDPTFFYECVKDYLMTNACYGLLYQDKEDNIIYTRLSSLQTVAIYDYSTPSNKIALFRIWVEQDSDGNDCNMIEITTADEVRFYKNGKKKSEYKEIKENKQPVEWDFIPIFSVENPDELAVFELVIPLIDAFENIIKNNRNTFEYNDKAKLHITGFTPDNPRMIEQYNEKGELVTDDNGNPVMIKNQARVKEDNLILEAPVFYTPDATGSIDWLIKNINDTASENHKKTLIELILMTTCIPNFTDIGFTRANNSSALEKKFFPLEQLLIQADKLFKKELLLLWENVISTINDVRNTKYDFRDISIELKRNIPYNNEDIVKTALQLRGLLADETVIGMLPYDLDVESELAKKAEETDSSLIENIEYINDTEEEVDEYGDSETEDAETQPTP